MNRTSLREFAVVSIGKDPTKESENPAFDSLDKLEIISAVHDHFGEKVADVAELDNFVDLDSLYEILRAHGLVE